MKPARDRDDIRSDSDSAYYDAYFDPDVHRLMLEDKPRTEAYMKAILDNAEVIKGKVVMDIGAGSGILSLFAYKAGAKKVYAVEKSGMAEALREIIEANGEAKNVIEVVNDLAENAILSEKVDVIVSEWMGFYLLHESMLTSVIAARDKHLKESGVMLPSHASIYTASCQIHSEEEIIEKREFWTNVYGFDMSVMNKYHSKPAEKPIIRTLPPKRLLTEALKVADFDLRWTTREEIEKVLFTGFASVTRSPGGGVMEGIALWFDVDFDPDRNRQFDDRIGFEPSSLSTSPCSPATHWQQTVIPLGDCPAVETDEIVGWRLNLSASEDNPRFYRIALEMLDPETEEHPVPCGCKMAKCALIQALLEKEDELESV